MRKALDKANRGKQARMIKRGRAGLKNRKQKRFLKVKKRKMKEISKMKKKKMKKTKKTKRTMILSKVLRTIASSQAQWPPKRKCPIAWPTLRP